MTLCVVTGYQCICQPDEGAFCPDYEPDEYVQFLMNAIKELIIVPAHTRESGLSSLQLAQEYAAEVRKRKPEMIVRRSQT